MEKDKYDPISLTLKRGKEIIDIQVENERQVINISRLTDKQKTFINEYLIDLNATQAAIRAGYSKKNAFKIGSELLTKVRVHEQLTKRLNDREKRTEIAQDNVINELAKIAFCNGSDFAKVVTEFKYKAAWNNETQRDEVIKECVTHVELIDTDELPEDKRAAISSIKETKYGIEVNTCDKLKALELLGKHLGMFTDRVEIKGSINNPFNGISTEELKKIIYDDKTKRIN